MATIYLTDEACRDQLYPFTLTRHAADIRVGILTIREKWKALSGSPVEIVSAGTGTGSLAPDSFTADFVETGNFPNPFPANILPSKEFVQSIKQNKSPLIGETRTIEYPWDIYRLNDWAIRQDFQLLTEGRQGQLPGKGIYLANEQDIFIEESAQVGSCWINATAGPVYIGKEAVIMDGAMIYGPVAIGQGAVIKMGAKIYGATTIGPYSIAGGEIKNSVMMAFSNKAHDGYLGDAVLGEWCNLGAGTSNSNIKNTAGEVAVWHPALNASKKVGLKCGLIMGDYSRASINTSFNTGTMVGICANVFGNGLTPKYIPSFAWGSDGSTKAGIDKTLEHINNWKKLKGKELSENEIQQLKHIFEHYKY